MTHYLYCPCRKGRDMAATTSAGSCNSIHFAT